LHGVLEPENIHDTPAKRRIEPLRWSCCSSKAKRKVNKTMLKKIMLAALIALSFVSVAPVAQAELDIPICYPCVR
jgi:hypothetical protein